MVSKTKQNKTNKQTHRNGDQTRGVVWGKGNWMKVVKRYKLPIRRLISSRDVIYNKINIVNTVVIYVSYMLYMKVKRVNYKHSYHMETIYIFIFLLFCAYIDDSSLNLLW